MATEEGEMWDDMMLGRMNGNRWTRRPRIKWLDTVKDEVLDCQMEKKATTAVGTGRTRLWHH